MCYPNPVIPVGLLIGMVYFCCWLINRVIDHDYPEHKEDNDYWS